MLLYLNISILYNGNYRGLNFITEDKQIHKIAKVRSKHPDVTKRVCYDNIRAIIRRSELYVRNSSEVY